MIEMGVGETDVSISLDTLYAENRKMIDPIANRYFFVWDPMEIEIKGIKPRIATPPLHPTGNRGHRTIELGTKIFICREDAEKLKIGDKLRLKDLYNIEITSLAPLQAKHTGDLIETVNKGEKRIRIIHWAPVDGLSIKVLAPHGEFKGIGEKQIVNELDNIVQFERFGFCRIDSVDHEIIAYFAHK